MENDWIGQGRVSPEIHKDEIVYKLLCMACLCVGRSVKRVTDEKYKQFYMDALNEIPLCNTPQICPSVCWECSAMLHKVITFREQVKDSYRILQTYTSESFQECLLTDIIRPPRLKTHIPESVDIPPSTNAAKDNQDSTGDESVPKSLLVCVKDEVKIEWNNDKDMDDTIHSEEFNPSDNNEDVSENIKTSLNINRKRRKTKSALDTKRSRNKKIVKHLQKKKKHLKRTKSQRQQNILTIELSYEDMLLERDRESTRESYVNAKYKCDTCLVGFNYSKSYKAHMAAKHSPSLGEYMCPICKTVISSVDSFTAHYKRHMRRYECNVCHKRTMDPKAMQQHYYSAHDVTLRQYRCDVCGKISNSLDSHRYHKDTHKARVQCLECDKTFSHRAGLMNHRVAMHELQNTFPCTVCEKVFKWKTSLKRHLEKHDSKETSGVAYCATCSVSFASISSYQRHMKNSLKHVTQDQLRYICDDCGRRFADKTKLRDHIEAKHLHRTFQCHICLKPSKNRVSLDQHVRNVHKGRPNNKMCHHCGKGFPTKVQLESHIRTHTGERPFICEYCPTTFSQQSNLYKHNKQDDQNAGHSEMPTSSVERLVRETQSSDSTQRVDRKERDRRYRERHREVINQRRRENRQRQQNVQHSATASNAPRVHLNIKSKRYTPISKKKEKDATDESTEANGEHVAIPYTRPVAVLHYSPERGFVM